MAIISCPVCRKPMRDSADQCPNCGFTLTSEARASAYRQRSKARKTARKIMKISLALLSCIGIILTISLLIDTNKKSDPTNNNRLHSTTPASKKNTISDIKYKTDDELIEQAAAETGFSEYEIRAQFYTLQESGVKDRYEALILALGMIKDAKQEYLKQEDESIDSETVNYRNHPRYDEVYEVLIGKGLSPEMADITIRDMITYGTMPD